MSEAGAASDAGRPRFWRATAGEVLGGIGAVALFVAMAWSKGLFDEKKQPAARAAAPTAPPRLVGPAAGVTPARADQPTAEPQTPPPGNAAPPKPPGWGAGGRWVGAGRQQTEADKNAPVGSHLSGVRLGSPPAAGSVPPATAVPAELEQAAGAAVAADVAAAYQRVRASALADARRYLAADTEADQAVIQAEMDRSEQAFLAVVHDAVVVRHRGGELDYYRLRARPILRLCVGTVLDMTSAARAERGDPIDPAAFVALRKEQLAEADRRADEEVRAMEAEVSGRR